MPPPHPLLGISTRRLGPRGMWGEHRDRLQTSSLLRRGVDLGVDLIEVVSTTASPGPEDLVRHALAPYPATLGLAWRSGLARRDLLAAALHRLGVEQVDLLVVPASQADAALALVEAGMAFQVALVTGPGDSPGLLDDQWARRTAEGLVWPDGGFTPVLAAETLAEVERAAAVVIPPAAGPG